MLNNINVAQSIQNGDKIKEDLPTYEEALKKIQKTWLLFILIQNTKYLFNYLVNYLNWIKFKQK